MSGGGKRSIRAVTLDLDDTLWPCEPTLLRAERLTREWLTERVPEVIAPWSIERLRERRMAIHAARPELKHDFVTIRRLALQEVFRAAGADDVQSAQIIEGSLDVYMTGRNQVELYPEVLACLERLSAEYRIASLSNGNACLVKIGLDHLFHATIAAHTHGASKPDPALFHVACRELGCAPEEVVHLGDDIELDVRGARGAGLHAVWINRTSHAWPGDDVPDTVADLEAFERWLAQG
ncbi:MAG TPA: HAD family hydrolase [Burkholderiales bacterium]|nr:HAD family hydrolase [Burkholderiales bacterium]